MTLLHLFANYMAVTSLVFESLNKDRLLILLDSYCVKKSTNLPIPTEVNLIESPFLGLGLNEINFCGKKINFGASLKQSNEKNQLHLAKIKQDMEVKKFAVFESSGI